MGINDNIENMSNSINQKFDDTMTKIEQGFSNLEKSHSNTVENIIKNESKYSEKSKNLTKYRTEYDALMDKKRYRSLSTYENKKLVMLKSNVKYWEDLVNDDFTFLENQYKLKNISDTEYYAGLSKLRDMYFKEGSEDWAKYTIKIMKLGNEIIDNQKEALQDALKDIEDEYEASMKSIMNKQENMQKKLMNISDIYNKVSAGTGPDGQSYTWLQLSNIDLEISQLTEYNDKLLSMKEKITNTFKSLGFDGKKLNENVSEFFSQVAELDINEGIGFSNYLLNISPDKLSSYLGKWATKKDLSESISKSLYFDEAQSVTAEYAQNVAGVISDSMIEGISAIPEAFYKNGTQACTQFKNGFLSAFDSVLEQISSEIDKKLGYFSVDTKGSNNTSNVTNNSNYNIYGSSSPYQTAFEIYKYETRKRLLTENG